MIGVLECLPESADEFAHHAGFVPNTQDTDDDHFRHGHCCHGGMHYVAAIVEVTLFASDSIIDLPEDRYVFSSLTYSNVPPTFPP